MDRESVQSLTRIGRSLWGDGSRSMEISENTLTSVSLLHLNNDQTVEHASKAMIERAEKYPPKLLKLSHPFFRLAPIERFLLTTLHLEKWSYAKVARTLGIEEKLIEPWAWATRLKYCFQELEVNIHYPHGPSHLGPNCPEYNASAPWTQRLLDDEMQKRERLVMQNHIMACDRCRKTLEHARNLFFKIESLIPVRETSPEIEEANDRIMRTWQEGEVTFRPMNVTPEQSFLTFFSQPKIQFVLACLGVFILYWFTRKT